MKKITMGTMISQCIANACTEPMKNPFPTEYNWQERHNAIIAECKKRAPDMIFIGDSITHYFGGRPVDDIVRGGEVWEQYYAPRNPVNMGCGWDRTQHMLWRLDNGCLDNINPRLALVLAGTNNVLWEDSSAEDIAEGVRQISVRISNKLPDTKILLSGILPFGEASECEKRSRIREINRIVSGFADNKNIFFVDAGAGFMNTDGNLKKELFVDGLHPNCDGYSLYAKTIEPTVALLLKK